MAEYCEYKWSDTTPYDPSSILQNTKKCPKNREYILQIVKNQLEKKLEYKNFPTNDTNLLRFLYSRKFDIQESMKLIENYKSFKQTHEELFQVTMSTKQALRDGFPILLENRDRKGRCILVMFASNWENTSYTFIDILRALIYSLENLTLERINQICGFILIIDWNELTLRQSTKLTPHLLLLVIKLLQDNFPVRIKAVHFVTQPWYIDTALIALKTVLNEKSRNRIFVHGNNLATLHAHVPTDVLPTELGGEGAPLNRTKWADQILQNL